MRKVTPPTAPSNESVGIYIHIPFCKQKCRYCDFYSLCGYTDSTLERYRAALERQICETAPTILGQADTVYFGGGTPTVFGEKRLVSTLSVVQKQFSLTKDAEITLEANPESADRKLLKKLRRAGFNRISLGVQSTNDDELCRMGRLHDSARAREAVAAARAAGFENLSLDLMYGVEGQTADSWRQTLEDAVALEPEHISAYGLKVEPGTPLALAAQEGSALLPSDDAQAEHYEAACRLLAAAGYRHYEISNWAKPSRESRHNLRYWRLEPYCGFGAAAHSDAFGARSAAPRDIERYMTAVEQGGEIFEEYERIGESERAFEYVMLSLRTAEGLDERRLARSYRLDPASFIPEVLELERQGLCRRENGHVHLSESGFLLSNTLILRLFGALKPLENRYAKERR